MEELLNQQTSETTPAPTQEGKKKKLRLPKSKKARRWIKILLVLAVVVGLVMAWMARAGSNINSQISASYLVERVVRQELTVSVSGTATLQAADSYNVTTLISGEIMDAPFEEGDLVTKDTLLYAMDSGDAQSNLDRSNIAVSQAQLSYDMANEAMRPTAPLSGIISAVMVHDGDSVNAGSPLCTIRSRQDVSADFLFPYVSPDQFYVGQPATVFIDNMEGSVMGTVVSVSDVSSVTTNGMATCSVRVKVNDPGVISTAFTASAVIGSYTSYGSAPVSMPGSTTVYASGSGTVTGFNKLLGSTVSKGDTLCQIESESMRTNLQNARLSLQSSRLSAESAAKNLENYRIESPISGTVIEKKFKAGDKVEGMTSGTLATIFDLSYLKLEMAVDELDIGKVAVGQQVEITADALEGAVFSGVVDKVSINGTTANGATSYPVTIIIEEYGELRPGMNVSAKIIGEEIGNVLCIPVDAVSRGNVVTVPGEGAMNAEGTAVVDMNKLETRQVSLGRNDETYIEVTEGLEEGEIVLISNQASSLMQMMMGG